MNLTLYSDYSLRVLIYLSVSAGNNVSIKDIAQYYDVSKDHLVKVVHNLSKLGYIKTSRGRGGGIQLAHDPSSINIGRVLRATEPNFHIVECFNTSQSHCRVLPICNLKHALEDALESFMKELDRYTLADLIKQDEGALHRIGLGSPKILPELSTFS